MKLNGKKLYELARTGQVIEREPRRIRIISIAVEEINLPFVTMTVACSKGTYIRTLCHDIGKKLGCGAAMDQLLRVRSGQFYLEDSLKLSEICRRMEENSLEACVIRPDSLFAHYPALTVKTSGEKLLYNGNPMPIDMLEGEEEPPENGTMVRIYDMKGEFIGIYCFQAERQWYRPKTLFLG